MSDGPTTGFYFRPIQPGLFRIGLDVPVLRLQYDLDKSQLHGENRLRGLPCSPMA